MGICIGVLDMLDRLKKGSYTVEAAILIPIYLFIMVGTIQIAISLYNEIKENSEVERVQKIWAVEEFYRNELIEELLKNE